MTKPRTPIAPSIDLLVRRSLDLVLPRTGIRIPPSTVPITSVAGGKVCHDIDITTLGFKQVFGLVQLYENVYERYQRRLSGSPQL